VGPYINPVARRFQKHPFSYLFLGMAFVGPYLFVRTHAGPSQTIFLKLGPKTILGVSSRIEMSVPLPARFDHSRQ
jgi:hypothetical protein